MRNLLALFCLFGLSNFLLVSCVGKDKVDGSNSFVIEEYLQDFEALKLHVSQSYANLEYLLDYHKIDPVELNLRTIKAIKSSRNEEEAIEALKAFVKTFKDGHFQLISVSADQRKGQLEASFILNKSSSSAVACERMGFQKSKDYGFKFGFDQVNALHKGGKEFPFLIAEDDQAKIGVIRIADFRETVYFDLCRRTWAKYKDTLQSECDKSCQDDFKYEAMRETLVDQFYQSLSQVQKHNIDALVVDLTNNGGGSDWVDDITALLTTRQIRCGKSGFIKHDHHRKNFESLLEDIKQDAPADSAAIVAMKENIRVASEKCDRNPLWSEKNFQLDCSLVGYRKLDGCKYDQIKFESKKRYDGRLFLLINRHTASAAEDIVARHKDSNTASIIGERTYGAGCGYSNGGIRFRLPNSGLEVRVPDCVRSLLDGTNEVAGISPQIAMNMDQMNQPDFFKRLIERIKKEL